MLTLLGCTTGGEDWIDIHRFLARMFEFPMHFRTQTESNSSSASSHYYYYFHYCYHCCYYDEQYYCINHSIFFSIQLGTWPGLVYTTGSVPGGVLVFFIAASQHEDGFPDWP